MWSKVFARCKQYFFYLRMSNNSGAEPASRLELDGPPEPDPFTPDEFGAWRGMLRVHSTVFRELDRRLLAEHAFGVDAYGVLITLVTAPARSLPIGELGVQRNLSPSGVSRSVDRLANGRPRPAQHKPSRPAQPTRRADARRSRTVTRRTGHTPRGGPRTAPRPPDERRPQATSPSCGKRPCPALSQAPSGRSRTAARRHARLPSRTHAERGTAAATSRKRRR